MAEVIIAIAAKLAEYMVEPTLREARYCFCFNTFLEVLAEEKRELESKRENVKQRVHEVTQNKTERIEKSVEEWLKAVDDVLAEVNKLEAELEASRCRHNLAKQLAKTTGEMNKLNKNKFEQFSRPAALGGMEYYSSKDFTYFKSTKSAYNKLLAALKDEENDIMGLYGMGGSGKTALVQEVGKKAEELFDKVVMAHVSHTPNVRNIQDHLINALGLKIGEQTQHARAQRLSQRLRSGRTLIILDDVWECLDFLEIGILNNKDCRVLITTRCYDVCRSMHCQKIFQLSLLTKDESWTLFKRCARITEDDHSVKDVAEKIADKCQGLPIAITTVGRTLTGKSPDRWYLALSRLGRSRRLDVTEGLPNPYECLKLSYDNLTNPLARSIFLLCSIFPEDSEIEVEDLVLFGKGLLLIKSSAIGTSGSMEEARTEINEAVNILLDFCLLLHTESKERVKVHNMVRDVALWIASTEGQQAMVYTGKDPSILAEDDTIESKARISLWDSRNSQFHDKLNKLPDPAIKCSALDMLLLHSEDVGFEIPSLSLEGMGALKVLAFMRFRYRWNVSMLRWGSELILSMPQSNNFLTNLRTLCLRGYKLGDISVLESLSILEILDLRGSSFAELPNGIAALKKLKLLDLFMCSILKNNPYEVVGRCSKLEELYIWTDRDDSIENISFPRLQRYAIVRAKTKVDYFESDLYNFLAMHGPSRALCLEDFDASVVRYASSSSAEDLFLSAEGLYLENLQGGCKNIIPNIDKRGMNQLTGLVLYSCLEIESLLDTVSFHARSVFLKLIFLRLIKMEGLTEVFCDRASFCTLDKLEELRIEECGRLHSISFPKSSNLCKLKIIRLKQCRMLKSVFPQSICQTLLMLEELRIRHCAEMNHVIADDKLEERTAGGASNQTHNSKMFQHLRILDVQDCESLESIIPVTFTQGLERLEEINIRKNRKLKYVFGPHISMDEIVMVTKIKLLALRKLRLNSLPNLIDICPEETHLTLQPLNEFEYMDCPRSPRNTVVTMMQLGPQTTMEKVSGVHETHDKGKGLVKESGLPGMPPKPGLGISTSLRRRGFDIHLF